MKCDYDTSNVSLNSPSRYKSEFNCSDYFISMISHNFRTPLRRNQYVQKVPCENVYSDASISDSKSNFQRFKKGWFFQK